MCKYALMNKCDRGENCTFAHDISELRIKPDMRKTKLCKSYILGKCTDQNCIYAHSVSELREVGKPAICQLHREGRCIKGDQCRFAHSIDDINTKLVQYYGMSEDDTTTNNKTNATSTTPNNSNDNNHTNSSSSNPTNHNNNDTTNSNLNNTNNQENENHIVTTKNNIKNSVVLHKVNTLMDLKNGSTSNNAVTTTTNNHKSKKDTWNSTNCSMVKDDGSNSSRQSAFVFPSICKNKKSNGNVNLNKTNLIHNAHPQSVDLRNGIFRNETKKETHLNETTMGISYLKDKEEDSNLHHCVSNELMTRNPISANYNNFKDTKLYSLPTNDSAYSFNYDNVIMSKNTKESYALSQRMEKTSSVGISPPTNVYSENYLNANISTEALNEKPSSFNLHSLLALNSSAASAVPSAPSSVTHEHTLSSDGLLGLEHLIHFNNFNNINTINLNNVNVINHLNNMNNLNNLNSLNTMNMNAVNYEEMLRRVGPMEQVYELMKANTNGSVGSMNHLFTHPNSSMLLQNEVDPSVLYNTDSSINGYFMNFQKKQKNAYHKLNSSVNGTVMNGSLNNVKIVKEKLQKELNMKNAAFLRNKKIGVHSYMYHESSSMKDSGNGVPSNDVNIYRMNDSLKQVEQYLYLKQNALLTAAKGEAVVTSDMQNGIEVEGSVSLSPELRAETVSNRKMKKSLGVSEEMNYETSEAPIHKMESMLCSTHDASDSNQMNNQPQGQGGMRKVDVLDPALLEDTNRVNINVKMLLPMLLQMEKVRRMEQDASSDKRECMIGVGKDVEENKREMNHNGMDDSLNQPPSKTLDFHIKKEIEASVSNENSKRENLERSEESPLEPEKQDSAVEMNTTNQEEHEKDMESKKEQKTEKEEGEEEKKEETEKEEEVVINKEDEQREETLLHDVNKESKEYTMNAPDLEKEKYKEHISLLKKVGYLSNHYPSNYINESMNEPIDSENTGVSSSLYFDKRKFLGMNAGTENGSNFIKYIEKHKGGISVADKSFSPIMKNGMIAEYVRKDIKASDDKDYYKMKRDFIRSVNILNRDMETKSSYNEKELHSSQVLFNKSVKTNNRNTYSLFYEPNYHNQGRNRETLFGFDRKKDFLSNVQKEEEEGGGEEEEEEIQKGIVIPKVMNLLHSCKKGVHSSSSNYNDIATTMNTMKNRNEFFLNFFEDSVPVNEKIECGSDHLVNDIEPINLETSRMMHKELHTNELKNNGKKEISGYNNILMQGRGKVMNDSMNCFFYDPEKEAVFSASEMDSKLYEHLEMLKKSSKVVEEKNRCGSKYSVNNEYVGDFQNNNNNRYTIIDQDKLHMKNSSFNHFHQPHIDYEHKFDKSLPMSEIQNRNLLSEADRDMMEKSNGKATHIFTEMNHRVPPGRSLFNPVELANSSEEKDSKPLFDFNIRNLTMDYIDIEADQLFLNSASTKEVNSFRISQGQHTSNNSISSIDENTNNVNIKNVNNTNRNKMCLGKRNILKEDAFVNRNSSTQGGTFLLFPSEKNNNNNLINDAYSFYESTANTNSFVNFEKTREGSDFSIFNLMENTIPSSTDVYHNMSSLYNYTVPSNNKSLKNANPSKKQSLKNEEEMECMEIGSRIGFPFLNNKE